MSRAQTNKPRLFVRWLGIEIDAVSGKEKIISMIGGFVSIAFLLVLSQHLLASGGAEWLVASMGASAVLLFAVPHGQLSQPWPVLAGHIFSAFIGVTCAHFIANVPLVVGGAVGLTILMMHQLKCIHPPGGATALTAVIGGAHIRHMEYSFVWSPVALNALGIVLIAVAFDFLFAWRHYPAAWNQVAEQPNPLLPTRDAVIEALRSIDSFVDISEDDLLRLHRILSDKERG